MKIRLPKLPLFLLILFGITYSCSNAKEVSKDKSTARNSTMIISDFTHAKANYAEYCASCHGVQMEAFVDRKWKYGKKDADLFKAIKVGYLEDGMPAYDTAFTDVEINELVAYIQDGIKNVDQYQFAKKEKGLEVIETEEMDIRLDTVVSGLTNPWGMTFLPGGDLLFTERSGQLYRLAQDGKKQKIAGVPEVSAKGQGGLLDVLLHPQFVDNNWVYLSYSKAQKGTSLTTTAVLRAKLMDNRLTESEVIFEALPYAKTRHHYGSRLEFDQQGYLFISVGDRGSRDKNPQNLDNHCGKIHRIHDDGRIPDDNPFVDKRGAMPSIYSYGHRNPQGLAMHPETGKMWDHEHGPKGGDEVNIIEKGKNYGWPIISYGINYNGTTFTDKTAQAGMEQPELYWVPSIAPCGSTFVLGDRYPAWKGDLLVGSLRFDYVNRCIVKDNKVIGQEKLLENIGRVRAIEMSRDGYIYVSVEGPGFIFRLIPENS